MTICNTISASKANRLFWLGRYAERVYIELHLLRRYHDRMLDGDAREYEEYYRRLEIPNPYDDAEGFKLGFLYDRTNPASIISGLTSANDNAIVLREEIKSETMGYIQLSLVTIERFAALNEENITNLQPITDYLLAFWGSIDERLFDERVRNFLRMGRFVELTDMLLRFEYPYFRVVEAFEALRECSEREEGILDKHMLVLLQHLLGHEEDYDITNLGFKAKAINYLNHLVLI